MVASPADYATSERVDIAVYSKDDQLQLVVEVKSKTAATADWAARMRRNLAAHLAIPNAPFFLLALPDHFYLWRRLPAPLVVVPPDYDVAPAPLLARAVRRGRRAILARHERGRAHAGGVVVAHRSRRLPYRRGHGWLSSGLVVRVGVVSRHRWRSGQAARRAMIAYVESNFILEVAYVREEHGSCNHLMALSEGHALVLALPAFKSC